MDMSFCSALKLSDRLSSSPVGEKGTRKEEGKEEGEGKGGRGVEKTYLRSHTQQLSPPPRLLQLGSHDPVHSRCEHLSLEVEEDASVVVETDLSTVWTQDLLPCSVEVRREVRRGDRLN